MLDELEVDWFTVSPTLIESLGDPGVAEAAATALLLTGNS